MQKILTAFLFILLAKFTTAQNVDIVTNKKLKALSKDKASVFIHLKTDTSSLQFVGSLKGTGKDSTTLPGDLYLLIKTQARALGSNCFMLKNYTHDSLNRPVIDIDAYYATESIMAANSANYETNEVFVFGSETSTRDSFSLNVNNKNVKFRCGTYLKFNLSQGEPLKLNKGGFTGATWKIKYEKEKAPVYLMIIGAGLGGGPLPPAGTIGITFNTGRIAELNNDYGQFLVQVLKRSE
jgi:hypothetical protein